MIPTKTALGLAISAVLLIGCDPGASASDTGALALSAAQVETLSSTESLAQVKDLTVLPNGEIWVLNSLEPLVVAFAPDGRILREFGKRGGGPTEFGAPTAFVTGGIDGEAWVFDAERHAVIQVSEEEADREVLLLPTDALPPTHLFGGREILGEGLRPARLRDDIVFAVNTPDFSDGLHSFWRSIWGADLVSYTAASGTTNRLVSLAETLGDPADAYELVGDFPPFPFWFRLWTVCGGATMRVYDRLGNQVRAFSADGSPLRSDTLPTVQPRPITKEQMARVGFGLGMLEAGGELTSRGTPEDSARIIAQLSRRVEGSPEHLDALLPRYTDMRCGSDGTVWLRRYDPSHVDLHGGLTWVAVAPGGALRDVTFPERFDPYAFLADEVWGVQRDALDVPTVARIALPGS